RFSRDWSSDVCSSDLRIGLGALPMKITLSLHGPLGASLSVESDRIDDIAHAYVSVLRLATSGVLPPLQFDGSPLPGLNTAVDAEIGRAAGRERGQTQV